MRMWMLPPEWLCQKHLCGEHVETHMLAGSLRRGKSLKGFLVKGLLEPQNLKARHDQLAREMELRGYNHQSPLQVPEGDVPTGLVDRDQSRLDLANRCEDCAALMLHSVAEAV